MKKTQQQSDRDDQIYQLSTLAAGKFSLQEVLLVTSMVFPSLNWAVHIYPALPPSAISVGPLIEMEVGLGIISSFPHSIYASRM